MNVNNRCSLPAETAVQAGIFNLYKIMLFAKTPLYYQLNFKSFM